MKLGGYFNNLLKPGYLHRGIAIFFLLFTLMDIMLPQYCEEEMAFSSAAETIIISDHHNNNAINNDAVIESTRSDTDPAVPASPENEDCCFCCCAHVLPAKHFFVAEAFIIEIFSNLQDLFIPSSPPQSTYHPPRFA